MCGGYGEDRQPGNRPYASSDCQRGWHAAGHVRCRGRRVTKIALVAGVGGAGNPHVHRAVRGRGPVAARRFSMALGEYTSVGTARTQAIVAEAAVEREELERTPEDEAAELVPDVSRHGALAADGGTGSPKRSTRTRAGGQGAHHPGTRLTRDEQPSPVVAGSHRSCTSRWARYSRGAFFGPGRIDGLAWASACGLFLAGAIVETVSPMYVLASGAAVAVRRDRERSDVRHSRAGVVVTTG